MKGDDNVMNMKFVKKILAVTLAASLMVAPAVTAGATTGSSEPSQSDSTAPSTDVEPSKSDSQKTETTTTESTSSSNSESSSASGSESSGGSSAPAVTPTSSVPGVGKSNVAGAYSLKTIPGAAVKLSGAEIAQQAGLASNATVFVRVYEINAAGSPLALKSINNAIASVGGTYIGAVNFDFGQKVGAKFQNLPEDVEVPVAFGVPKAYQGKKIGIVQIGKLGATKILEDQDDNPASITVPVSGGLHAYALFAY